VKLKTVIFEALAAVGVGMAAACLWTLFALIYWETGRYPYWRLYAPLWLIALLGITLFTIIRLIVANRRYRSESLLLILKHLPQAAADYIGLVIKYMRYRKTARLEVANELADHFESSLINCADENEKQATTQRIINEFGDPKLLAILMRRAKKRCRPLWQKIIARSFQLTCVLLVSCVVYVLWFINGISVIKIDYLAQINNATSTNISEQNAWPYYQKAIELLVEPHKYLTNNWFRTSLDHETRLSDLPPTERDMFEKWLSLNKPAWEKFRMASTKTSFYKPIYYNPKDNEKWTYRIPLPEYTDLRTLAGIGVWQIQMKLDIKDINGALDDCLTLAHAGALFQKDGKIVYYNFGSTISSVAHRYIFNILETQNLPREQLESLSIRLKRLYAEDYPMLWPEMVRLAFEDTVQHLFTESPIGGGHIIPQRLKEIYPRWYQEYQSQWIHENINDRSPQWQKLLDNTALTSMAIAHAGRIDTLAQANSIFDKLQQAVKMTPYQRFNAKLFPETGIVSELPKHKYLLIHIFTPDIWIKASDKSYQLRATHEAVITVLALKLWQLDKKRFPNQLNELIEAGYINTLPADPYSNTTLVYRKIENNFILYSVGPNFKDEGGIVIYADTGSTIKWDKQGDTVFWPVSK